ncbi:hypothetical protein M0813_26431 [Anaeramoeba flamelloides]|uniref:Uncharacterized protein n=1 Tax=Anaeramoeba flamelloides TaxID=1746091 RepID=A0ABQ8Y049_9EUKA|nr:hypothetical protein M0813_26431 [Anaeramoeba flamelloides]
MRRKVRYKRLDMQPLAKQTGSSLNKISTCKGLQGIRGSGEKGGYRQWRHLLQSQVRWQCRHQWREIRVICMLEFVVENENRFFFRDGLDLHIEVPITVSDAILWWRNNSNNGLIRI